MSTLVTKNVQVGTSATTSQNFLLYQPSTPDGTARIAYGATGSQTDVVTVTNGGNVGIGTNSPGHRLHVIGSGANAAQIRVQNTSSTQDSRAAVQLLSTTSTFGGGLLMTNASESGYQTSALLLYNYDNQPLIFGTTNTERMRVNSNGYVGIGTADPQHKFDVQGGRSMFTPSSENYAIGLRYNTSTSAVWLGSPAADTFAVFTGGGGELMRVRSNGSMSFSGQQLIQNYYQSGTFTPTSTKWWRVCTLPANNGGQHVEFIFTIPGQHVQLKVKFSKTTAGALGGGGILEVEQLGSYAYWNYYPFDWRLVDQGTNNNSHIDIRFPNNAGETIGYRIQVLNSWSVDTTAHATFPISDQGTGTTGSYYVNMGNAFSGWIRQWFKLTGSKYAFLDSSLTLSSGQTAPTA